MLKESQAFFQCKSIHLNQFIFILCYISQSPFTRFGFYNNRFVQCSYRYQTGVHSPGDKNSFIHARYIDGLSCVSISFRDFILELIA